jgi:hypothetical protein
MAHKRTSWAKAFSLLAIALLLLGATGGSLFHVHTDQTSADHCQICHLSHLPATQSVAAANAPVALHVIGTVLSEHWAHVHSAVCTHRSPRAPPFSS